MRPMFTLHAGEVVVGNHLEKRFRRLNLWVPAKDTGIDLLVSDSLNKRCLSLQIKMTKDYLPTHSPEWMREGFVSSGWFRFDKSRLGDSPADIWVFVLLGRTAKDPHFVVVSKEVLLKRVNSIHAESDIVHSYLSVTQNLHCWETRGLTNTSKRAIISGKYSDKQRNFTEYLNDWSLIARLS